MANPDESTQPVNGASEPKMENAKATKQPQKQQQQQSNGTASASSHPSEAKGGLSNAEKKKLQKEEKAARRAKEKLPPATSAPETPSASSNGDSQAQQKRKQAVPTQDSRPVPDAQRRRRESMAPPPATTNKLPLRPAVTEKARPSKSVSFFSHLYGQPRRRSLEGTSKDVHPAVSQLALQISSYTLCGSHCRGVAMLLAFKALVRSYNTPHGTSLSRHFVSHYLPPQIEHLKAARPISTTQANSIRWLKNVIAKIDPSAQEDAAKNDICLAIDTFISERFTVADQVIAEAVADRVQTNDFIVTFGSSAVVRSGLLTAAARGTQFKVIVVDSRPLFEGRCLAAALSASGLEVQYTMLHGLSRLLRRPAKCMLGAHTVFANGYIQARAGAALVAMTAKSRRSKVFVCAETLKFSEKALLDSFMSNEVAPEEELLETQEGPEVNDPKDETKATSQDEKKDLKGKPVAPPPNHDQKPVPVPPSGPLADWRDKQNLQILNLMYDVTPATYIDEVITELGSIPPESAAAVQRFSADVE